MGSRLLKWLKRVLVALALFAVAFLGVRAYDTQRGPPLEPWHTFVPDEMDAAALDAADWDDYLAAEKRIFESLTTHVTQRLDPKDRIPINRYFEGGLIYPGHFAHDWNRSYVLEPDGKPVGAVVLLHGLTDSPYSTRHIARRYRDRGFVAIAPRLPAHGTVPGALSDVEWEDWLAATRLAVREARRRTGPDAPLHLVGFSNGGALAMKYALDAIEDDTLARPTQLVLLSPMIGVTRFARFAGFAGLPALLPPFAKAAWLGIVPEFNPFKYNSFPINGATQSHALTMVLQRQIAKLTRDGRIAGVAPVLTFQSVMDFTVSTRAIITALYANLPANGSELVLFDINRTVMFGPLMRSTSYTAIDRLLPSLPQKYRITIIANVSSDDEATVERSTPAGRTAADVRPIGIRYPTQIFSLSHVAIPFPVDDSLYGLYPAPGAEFGLNLGAINARGERGALIVNLDSLFRIASNPFFPYMLERIEEGMTAAGAHALPTVAAGITTHVPASAQEGASLPATSVASQEFADPAGLEPDSGP